MFGFFGDSADVLFDSTLKSFQDTLKKLYREKSILIAKRETARYKYLTTLKSKFSNVAGEIYADSYAENANPDAIALIKMFLDYIQSKIPMVTLTSGTVSGWRGAPLSLGGRLRLNYLSQTDHWISEPFYDASNIDQRPMYQKYSLKNSGLDWALSHYFVTDDPNSNISYGGVTASFSMPPSESWVKNFLLTRGGSVSKLPLLQYYGYLVSKLQKEYPSGRMDQIVGEFRKEFSNIINELNNIIRVQKEIDVSEAGFADFINNYRDYPGNQLILDDALAQLRADAEKADVIPAIEIPAAPTVIATSVQVPEASPEILITDIVPVEKNSSKLPFAIAAVSIFLLTRSKKV